MTVPKSLLYSMAMVSAYLTPEQQEQYKHWLHCAKLLPVLASLGYSLGEYKKTMADFAVKMDAPNSDRNPDGLAELFRKKFPPELSFTNDGAWMQSQTPPCSILPSCVVAMMCRCWASGCTLSTFFGMLRTRSI